MRYKLETIAKNKIIKSYKNWNKLLKIVTLELNLFLYGSHNHNSVAAF